MAQGAAAHFQEYRFQQQTDKAHPLVHLSIAGLCENGIVPHTLQKRVDVVDLTVFLIQLIIDGKIPGDLLVLQILGGQLLADGKAEFFVILQNFGEVLPCAGRHDGQAVHGRFYFVEILGPDVQIADDAAADAVFQRVGFPCGIVRLDLKDLQAVAGGGVELADALVEAGRVSGCDDHPALRNLVSAKDFVLQKQQHGRRERFGDAVDLVQKQDALGLAGGAHTVVNAGDDLAHGVLADLIGLSAVLFFHDDGQSQCALAGVMGHGIAHKAQPHFVGDLLHDGGLAQTGRAQQKDRPLMHQRHPVAAKLVFLQIDLNGVFDLLFCTCYVHDSGSSSGGTSCWWSSRMLSVVSTARMAQLGTWGLRWSSRLKMNAVL